MIGKATVFVFLVLASIGAQAQHRFQAAGQGGFAVTVKPILDAKCVRCHENFGDYDSVKRFLVGTGHPMGSPLYVSITTSPRHMPPAGNPQITGSELQAITAWLSAGAPK